MEILISGFTIVRNINKLKYPAKEAIMSILPICDEFIINVCDSEDDTLETIKSINSPKIKIICSPWDTSIQQGGVILANQTNIALNECKGIWCFYIQADEVCHEDDLEGIQQLCKSYKDKKEVEGFLFSYLHFYGAYNVIATARNWYRKEVRVIRNNIGIKSFGDAQGFRLTNRKPRVLEINAHVFHYGWARHPKDMALKSKHFMRLYFGSKFDNAFDNFSYEQQYGLKYYNESHPSIMKEIILEGNNDFTIDKKLIKWNKRNARLFISDIIEKIFRYRIFEYKNYVRIGKA